MQYSVPVPPATLPPIPALERLPAGSVLHRVGYLGGARFEEHDRVSSYPPIERERVSRFAPITDANGSRISVLYAARTFEVAVYESLFHAVSPGEAPRFWPVDLAYWAVHSTLETRRDLDLVPLFSRTLIRWKVSDLEIIKAPPRCYRQTARWAEAIHRSIAAADGLVWIPNRGGSDRCYMFFGDRVKESEFTETQINRGYSANDLMEKVRRAALRSGIWW